MTKNRLRVQRLVECDSGTIPGPPRDMTGKMQFAFVKFHVLANGRKTLAFDERPFLGQVAQLRLDLRPVKLDGC